jgi:hypothetical protein
MSSSSSWRCLNLDRLKQRIMPGHSADKPNRFSSLSNIHLYKTLRKLGYSGSRRRRKLKYDQAGNTVIDETQEVLEDGLLREESIDRDVEAAVWVSY